jgi:cytochrome c553
MVLLLGIGTKTVSAAEPTKPTPEQTEHFEKKIRPLLIEHCGKCHMDGKTKGGLSMNHRGELLKGGDSGPSLIPGDAAKSLLMQVIRYDGDMKMPPRGKLRDDEIATLEAWVKSGAYWPGAANTKVETQPGILFTADQKAFWAFQPIAKPTVPDAPALKNLHPIDAFVRSAQLGQGLTAAGPADRRTLTSANSERTGRFSGGSNSPSV